MMQVIDWIGVGLTCAAIVGVGYLAFVFFTEFGDDA